MGVALAEVAQRVGGSITAVSKIIQKDSQLVNSVNNVPKFLHSLTLFFSFFRKTLLGFAPFWGFGDRILLKASLLFPALP